MCTNVGGTGRASASGAGSAAKIPSATFGASDPAFTISYVDEGITQDRADDAIKSGRYSAADVQSIINDRNINVSVGVPKYEGTERQVAYANKLAEGYVYNLLLRKGNSGFNGVSSPEKRTKFEASAKARGFTATPQGFLEHTVKTDETLNKILNTKSASTVIDTLKGVQNMKDESPNYRFRHQMKKK